MFRDTSRRSSALTRVLSLGLGAAITAGALAVFPTTASAFKPYTHNWTAEKAYDDVVEDSMVTINGVEYAVRPEIVNALKNQPAAYNAGVIGPDGFPDLAYGQSQIHPEETGEWLQHVYTAAWDAQDDPGRSAAEKEQILAFAYGFMTHAAGDMWMHTMINKIAEGVFPGIGEIVNPDDLTAAEIALRHVIAEGYVGDATEGYDGNPERDNVPGEFAPGDNGGVLVDYSDDSTPRYPYAAPTAWIYETLVDPTNPLPVGTCGDNVDDDNDGHVDDGCPGGPFTYEDPEPLRGPLIDFFLDMQADLQIEKAKFDADALYLDCTLADEDCYPGTQDVVVQTVRGTVTTTIDIQWCDFDNATTGICGGSLVDQLDDWIVNSVGSAYLDAWIDDITTGLQHWPEFGLGLSQALFDAGTYRDAQNFFCRNDEKSEDGMLPETDRVKCEEGVNLPMVLGYTLGGLNEEDAPEGFITEYLLSMLGAPDFVGDLADFAGDALVWLQDVLSYILPDIDIFDASIEAVQEWLLGKVSESLGFDVEEFFTFLKSPAHWMEIEQATMDLPFLGTQTVDLFDDGDREYLDDIMGLEENPLVGHEFLDSDGNIIYSSRLKDDAVWTLEDFEVAHNAVTMSKLLLLDANGLNKVLADNADTSMLLPGVALPDLYADHVGRPANVMIDGLDGKPWLRSIDSDHSWRHDRLPEFTTPGYGHHGTGEGHYAGTGQFPLWESCLARSAFRSLFRDWENGDWHVEGNNFPALGDAPSAPAGIAGSLTTELIVTGQHAVIDGANWVGANHAFVVTAADTKVKPTEAVTRVRTYPFGYQPGPWTEVAGQTATFALPAEASEDLQWVAEWEVDNGCETVGGKRMFHVDRTAPEVVVSEPAASGFDTDDTSSIVFTATDARTGIATEVATFDGASATNGQVLDMYTLATGAHAVVVTATDLVGNTTTVTKGFTLLATTASLRNNIDRALAEGAITDPKVYKGFQDKLDVALKSHAQGKHATEELQLQSLLEQVQAQSGKGLDTTVAARMIGWINDLIAAH